MRVACSCKTRSCAPTFEMNPHVQAAHGPQRLRQELYAKHHVHSTVSAAHAGLSNANGSFANKIAKDTRQLGATIDVETTKVRFMGNLRLDVWDCAGQESPSKLPQTSLINAGRLL
jgi:hypothetical protein